MILPSNEMEKIIPTEILQDIFDTCGFECVNFSPIGGGCINHGGRFTTRNQEFFLKWNSSTQFPGMFNAEAKGLSTLKATNTLRIPEIVATGNTISYQYLLLEFIERRPQKHDFWHTFGKQLAMLHRHSHKDYGLDHDNYIGSLAQSNSANKNWVNFFINNRIETQLRIAFENKSIDQAIKKKFEKLYQQLPSLLPVEQPALLHGDLWSGNLLSDDNGNPCLIDPAVYYGNREVDLAMTTLFGGFDSTYLQAYNEVFPLIKGYQTRFEIYTLYPLLVHVNLFGRSYLTQVVSILNRYV